MSYELIATLTVFTLVASMTPGPNNVMLLSSGATYGFRRSVPHITGVVSGFLILVILGGVGLMQVFAAFPASYLALKFASIAYLLFLAWKIATAAPPDTGENQPSGGGGRPLTFWQAALFQYVNPKGVAFAFAALSAYTPPSRPLHSVFIVAAIFTVSNTLSTCTWTLAGVQVRRLLSDPLKLRIFNITAAVLLVGSLYPILFD